MAELDVGEAKRKPNFGFAKGTISMSEDYDQADGEIAEMFDESV